MTIKVVVLGGAVMDHVWKVKDLPRFKQAVQADRLTMLPGGKGLNQAIAAARLGAEVTLVSAVGDDHFGSVILDYLKKNNVNCDFIEVVPGDTPVTDVFVNYQGEPAFLGLQQDTARKVGEFLVQRAEERIKEAKAVLISLEVSLEAVKSAISIAKRHETLVILNPAPPLKESEHLSYPLLKDVDVLVPNTWEAAQIVRFKEKENDPAKLALQLYKLGARIACVTTSEAGCVVAANGAVKKYQTVRASPEDTTGGSDAFCAALAIAMCEGKPHAEMFERANAAGFLSVSKPTASDSMPTLEELEAYLAKHRKQKSGIPVKT